jgi:DNA-binding transcriptional LysR family regulator
VATDGNMLINDNLLILDAALKGKGVIKMPCYLVQPALDNGHLQQILSDYQMTQSSIYLIYPPQLRRSTKLSAFVDFVQQWFGDDKLCCR